MKSQRNGVKKTPRAPHPPSGKVRTPNISVDTNTDILLQVIPEQPEYMKTGDSTKQGHFVAHSSTKDRLGNIKHNSVSEIKV